MNSSKKEQPYTSKLRGVAALLGEDDRAAPTQSLAIEVIRLPQLQPRRYFDPEKLEQLILSVKEYGILEPLLVRPLQYGKYELVAGERRYRAAKAADLAEVPVVIKELNDEEALGLSLIENLHREDLNPVEETEGILQLLALKLGRVVSEVTQLLYQMKNAVDRNLELRNNVVPQLDSQEQQQILAVFQGLGLMSWVSFTTHRLPLLNLPQDILEALREGKIAYTKATAISRVKDGNQRQVILAEAIAEDLSLNQIKERIASIALGRVSSGNSQTLSLKSRVDTAYRVVKKSKVWDDPKKQKRLEKLLAELEALTSE
jgi:ParB family chromosome partitioning protein